MTTSTASEGASISSGVVTSSGTGGGKGRVELPSSVRMGGLMSDAHYARFAPPDTTLLRQQKHVVRISDLLLSLELSPHLLDDNTQHLEKILNSLK